MKSHFFLLTKKHIIPVITPRQLLKEAFYLFGFDIKRLHPQTNAALQLQSSLDFFKIDLVLDVGANQGQFVKAIRKTGYRGSCVSFEPLSDAHRLLAKAALTDSRWYVHDRVALGSHEGAAVINIARNSASSSVLPMLGLHNDASPESGYTGSEAVPLSTLDSVAGRYLADATHTFLKVDVQGYEKEVFQGGLASLPHIEVVMCELSIVPLYDGQVLWGEMIENMKGLGFRIWALYPGFCHPETGRTLQVDALFVRG